MPPRFFLQTLGGLALTKVQAGESVLADHRKRLALLVYLAADVNGGVSRDRLFALFWPESDGDRARNALNQMVFALRRKLGDDVIASDALSLRLNRAVVDCDLQTFRDAVAQQRTSDVVALYRGPFLDGVFLRDTPDFERWADDVRRSLAADYSHALEREIDAASAESRVVEAVGLARRLAAFDPLSTQHALRLVRALEQAGDAPAALQHASVHAAHIRAELQTEPDPRLAAEVRRLRERGVDVGPQASGGSDAAIETETPPATPAIDVITPAAGDHRRRWSVPRILVGAACATLICGGVVATADAAAHGDSKMVVVVATAADSDPALDPLRESALRSTSELLDRSHRLTVIAAAGDESSGASCLLRFLTARCGAAFVVTERFVRIGGAVNVLTTVRDRAGADAHYDLPPLASDGANLPALPAEAAQAAAGAVAVLSDPTVPELRAAAQLPRYDAYVEYRHAVDATLSGGDPRRIVEAYRAAAQADSTFAAPRIALLGQSNGAERAAMSEWLAQHRALLSPHDQTLVDAITADERGETNEWFRLAALLRTASPHEQRAIREFADAAYSMNYWAASDSALGELQHQAGWMARDPDVLYAQIVDRHALGDFNGALSAWRRLRDLHLGDNSACIQGVLQYAALGREHDVDALIAQCTLLPDIADPHRLGRRVSTQDELYRRAGREYAWHGFAAAGKRALDKAYALERQLYAADTTANNGWLAKELSRDWPAAYRLMLDDFGREYVQNPCQPRDRRRGCILRNRVRFAVSAAHVGDTLPALQVIPWLADRPHADSSYKIEQAKVLLALGRRGEAIRSLREAFNGAPPAVLMHAQTELMDLQNDPEFEAIVAPRTP